MSCACSGHWLWDHRLKLKTALHPLRMQAEIPLNLIICTLWDLSNYKKTFCNLCKATVIAGVCFCVCLWRRCFLSLKRFSNSPVSALLWDTHRIVVALQKCLQMPVFAGVLYWEHSRTQVFILSGFRVSCWDCCCAAQIYRLKCAVNKPLPA